MKTFVLSIIVMFLIFFAYVKISNYFEEQKELEKEIARIEEEEKIETEILRIKNYLKDNSEEIEYVTENVIKVTIEENAELEIKSDLFTSKEFDEQIIFYYQNQKLLEINRNILPKNRLAIVIDDVGQTTRHIESFARIKEDISFAVLPFLPRSKESAEILQKKGYSVLLHMPMEALSSEYLNKNTVGLIRTSMQKDMIEVMFDAALANLGPVDGFNNHMGSKFTSDREKMIELMAMAAKRDLFFVDSGTTPKSVAKEVAYDMGVKTYYCSVFLDNKRDLDYIKDRIKLAVKKTKEEGKLVAIGHYFDVTAQAIFEMTDYIRENDVELVFVEEVLE